MIYRTCPCEFRASDDEGPVIEGYFAVFDEIYRMTDRIAEKIDPHAFDETLEKDDIRALVNHETDKVIGRNRSGTLALKTDGHGLWGRIKMNLDDQDAKNVLAKVRRYDVTQCSIGFDILDEKPQKEKDGVTLFVVRKVKLWEVSVVTFPAYTTTEVEARARMKRASDAKNRMFAVWQTEMKERVTKWH